MSPYCAGFRITLLCNMQMSIKDVSKVIYLYAQVWICTAQTSGSKKLQSGILCQILKDQDISKVTCGSAV